MNASTTYVYIGNPSLCNIYSAEIVYELSRRAGGQ